MRRHRQTKGLVVELQADARVRRFGARADVFLFLAVDAALHAVAHRRAEDPVFTREERRADRTDVVTALFSS